MVGGAGFFWLFFSSEEEWPEVLSSRSSFDPDDHGSHRMTAHVPCSGGLRSTGGMFCLQRWEAWVDCYGLGEARSVISPLASFCVYMSTVAATNFFPLYF